MRRLLLIFILLGAFAQKMEAQIDSAEIDSAHYDKDIYTTDYKIQRYYRPFELHIDSTIADTVMHLRDIHRQKYWDYTRATTGNAYAPSYSLLLDMERRLGPRIGYDDYLSMGYDDDSHKMFQTSIPFTVLYYQMGPKTEQEFRGILVNNLSPRLNVDVRLDKFNAPGFYSGEKTNHSRFAIQEHWSSRNLRWQNETYFRYLAIQHFQNGGIATDTLFGDTEYRNLRLFPTPFSDENLIANRNTSNWLDEHRWSQVGTTTRYVLGPSHIEFDEDSVKKTYTLDPKSYFQFGLDYTREQYRMFYKSPDSTLLGTVRFLNLDAIDTLGTQDTLGTTSAKAAYCQELQWNGNVFSLQVRGDFKYVNYRNNGTYGNVIFGGTLNYSNGKSYARADLDFYGLGAFVGDTKFDFEMMIPWKELQSKVDVNFTRASAPLFYNRNKFYNIAQDNELNPETSQFARFELGYKNLKVHFKYQSYYNFIYLQNVDSGMSYFINDAHLYSIYRLGIDYAFKRKNWGQDIQLYLQRVPQDFALSAPEVLGSYRIYLHDSWFDNHLYFYTGAQLDMTSKFEASPYDLFFDSFSKKAATSTSVQNINLQYFLNMQISRAKLFVVANQINQLFLKNYVLGTVRDYSGDSPFRYYGSPNVNIRFGVSWMMIN